MTKPKKRKWTAEAMTVELNCDVAAIVVRGMRRKKWTTEDLAKAVGEEPATIELIIHATHVNLSVGFIGRVLHALDMVAALGRCVR